MRLAIASTYVPFVRGGDRRIVNDLEMALRQRGHQVEVIRIPFCPDWSAIPRHTLAVRLFDLTESCGNPVDRLITIRPPAYALQHPNKVAWFIHHHRGAYDLWATSYGDIPDSPEGRRIRDCILHSDNLYLREARKLYTNSKVVAERLLLFNKLTADGVLYPPLLQTDHLGPGEFGDYFVYPARLNLIKRQALAIEAFSHIRSPFGLVLLGAADKPGFQETLKALAASLGLEHKIRFTGWVSEQDKAQWIANSCGALNLAYEEDSYGYGTLEAIHCHKPVVTCSDGGGSIELVSDGVTGLVVDPNPAALAGALEQLWNDKGRARSMGHEAFATLGRHDMSWDVIVERLVA